MNNKGQTLVLFVLLLPILIIIISMVINYGIISLEKKKIDDRLNDIVLYGIKNKDKEELETDLNRLMVLNIENIYSKEIKITENEIEISLEKELNGLFNVGNRKQRYIYKVKCIGNISNKNIRMERG